MAGLRSAVQLRRIQYAFIIVSLPIAAYAVLQYLNLDILPWEKSAEERVSATMGNPIFLGAYLMMVMPLTFSQFWNSVRTMGKGDAGKHGSFLACCYGLVMAIQVLALLSTKSRGPMIGLAVAGYVCLFIFLVLNRTPDKGRRAFPVIAGVLGLITPLLIIATIRMTSQLPRIVFMASVGAAVAIIAAFYFVLWRRVSWSKNWLWLTWFVQTAVVLLIFSLGPVQIMGKSAEAFLQLGRRTSELTVSVRQGLWQTSMKTMQSGFPETLPGGIRDSYHWLRPAIGYGPESIGLTANFYAVPGLVAHHIDDSVDRMHNETFDNLISIGFAGAMLFLFVVAAAVFYGLRYLGFLDKKHGVLHYAVFLLFGSTAGGLLPWFYGSPYLAGIGVPVGMLAGLFAFIGWCGFRRPPANFTGNFRQILMLCILCVLIAHFVEISVGIAVTPTRVYFFLLIAILSVLASGRLDSKEEEEPVKRRTSKHRSWYRNTWVPLAAIASLVVLVESWSFTINTAVERSALAVFIRTWFVQSGDRHSLIPFPGTLILMALTIGGGIGLMYVERLYPSAQKFNGGKITGTAAGFMVFVWVVMGIGAAFFWTTLDPHQAAVIDVARHAEGRMTFFVVALLLLIAVVALSIVAAEFQRYKSAVSVHSRMSWTGLLLIVPFIFLIMVLIRPVWADITYRTAQSYKKSGNVRSAVDLYKRAIEYAPHVVRYRITLGRIQLLLNPSSANQLEESIRSIKDALDLNPFDPFGYRAIGSLHVQFAERASEQTIRETHIRRAIPYYQQALRLAPNYPEISNELGRCYFLLGDREKAESLYQSSLQKYPEYARTYMYLGEMRYRANDLEGALQSFKEAMKLDWTDMEARKNTGFILALLGRREEAIRTNLYALSLAPRDSILLRRLASLNFGAGNYSAGLDYARRAYEVMPATERGSLDAFIEQLKKEAK